MKKYQAEMNARKAKKARSQAAGHLTRQQMQGVAHARPQLRTGNQINHQNANDPESVKKYGYYTDGVRLDGQHDSREAVRAREEGQLGYFYEDKNGLPRCDHKRKGGHLGSPTALRNLGYALGGQSQKHGQDGAYNTTQTNSGKVGVHWK